MDPENPVSQRPTLIAEDAEDLEVIASHLQDGITTVGELKFLKSTRRFVGLFTRFKWEEVNTETRRSKTGLYHRVRTRICFNTVLNVRALNISMDSDDLFLSLLTIDHRQSDDGLEEVRLVFSGDGLIRLTVEALDATLTDLGDPWRTEQMPDHPETPET